MKRTIEDWKFHKYNPDSTGEIIAEVHYETDNYKIDITALTVKEEDIKSTIKYVCNYSHGKKNFTRNVFDTYQGSDKEKIKIGLRSCIEFCYNEHRRGRNVKLF